jgi:ABC-type Fe3+-hydroxamate transport system substrate-binding protein
LAIDWLMSSLQQQFLSVTVYDNLDALLQAHPDVVVMLDTHNRLLTQRNSQVEARFAARFYDANLQYIGKAEGAVEKQMPSVWVHRKAAAEIAAQIDQQRDLQLSALKQFDDSLKTLVTAG